MRLLFVFIFTDLKNASQKRFAKDAFLTDFIARMFVKHRPAIYWISLLAYLTIAHAAVPVEQEPLAPGSPWLVNDKKRPVPEKLTPGDTYGQPPADADIIFDGTNTDALLARNGEPCAWIIENGELVTTRGDLRTKKNYGSAQLHLEWLVPPNREGKPQQGNGGVYMMGAYEVQIFNSHDIVFYADGMLGALYGQTPPLFNVAKKPGQWQTMDIIFNAPKTDDSGAVIEPARMTVLVNGVVVQNNTRLLGPTYHKKASTYDGFTVKESPIYFQAHPSNPPLRYRNIWVRPIKESDPLKN